MNIAIIHDWLVGMRGGEKVLDVLCDLFPDATLFTLVYREGNYTPAIDRMKKCQSFLQHLPFARRHYQRLLPLYPIAAEGMDLDGFDLVLSSSHAAAKAVHVPSRALHICYCHTPMRYIWDQYDQYFGPGRAPIPVRLAMGLLRSPLRKWDLRSARGVDRFVANSCFVRERIRRIYHREATVLHPPVDAASFAATAEHEGYYLVLSALVPYKRVELAIDAMTVLGQPLVVVGSGSEEKQLRRRAGGNVTFVGQVTQDQIPRWYAGCRALLFPGEEDFGIVPVEAMASGKPVIAFGSGGACDTVLDGETGILFPRQTPQDLIDAVRRFEGMTFDPYAIRRHAMIFDRPLFKKRLAALIAETIQQGGTQFRTVVD